MFLTSKKSGGATDHNNQRHKLLRKKDQEALQIEFC